MKNTRIFYGLLLALITLGACKKDSTHPEQPKPAKIEGVYRITGLKAQAANSSAVDVFHQLSVCQQNDTWDFQHDGTFLFGGAATGDCGDPDLSGTWELNGSTFTITTEDNGNDYRFISCDGHALTLSIPGTLNNEDATYFITFTKIQ